MNDTLLMILEATAETLYMSLVATFLAFVIGLFLAVILIITGKGGLKESAKVYYVLDIVINTLRSFPFTILIIILFPLTGFLLGTSIGTTAAIVPLTIGSAPFIARLIESAFKEVDNSLIEAAKSYGATNFQIIFKIIFVEALPGIISAITLTLIVVIGFSAMSGVVGGGGLGAVAYNIGYNGFRGDIILYTVIVLIIMVQIFHSIGNFFYKITKK